MNPPDPVQTALSGTSRAHRYGMLLVFVFGSVLLVGTAGLSYRDAHRASRLVTQGQAEAINHELRSMFEGQPGRVLDQDRVARALAAQADWGMTYLGVYDRSGGLLVESGQAVAPVGDIKVRGRPLEMQTVGERVRVVVSPPPRGRGGPRHGGPPRPRPGAAPGPPRPHFGGPPASGAATWPPPYVFEFEPLVANQLRSGAARGLGVATAGMLLLGLATVLLWNHAKAREQAERSAAQDRHFAVLGQLTATLSHELRTPLTSLKGHAQLLVAQLAEGSRQQAKARGFVADVERLQDLAEGLLRLARSGRADLEACDPIEVARLALSDADIAADPQVTGEAGPWVLDPEAVRHALSNLLRNAIEAGSPPDEIEVRVRLGGRHLEYVVRDRGGGLPPGNPDELFAAFRTGCEDGTGLGLALARQIARVHSGTVEARNRPGGGAEFVLSIPAGLAASAPPRS